MISVLGSIQPGEKFPLHRQLLVKYKDTGETTGRALDLQVERTDVKASAALPSLPEGMVRPPHLPGLFLPICNEHIRTMSPEMPPAPRCWDFSLPVGGSFSLPPTHSGTTSKIHGQYLPLRNLPCECGDMSPGESELCLASLHCQKCDPEGKGVAPRAFPRVMSSGLQLEGKVLGFWLGRRPYPETL